MDVRLAAHCADIARIPREFDTRTVTLSYKLPP